MPTGVDWGHGQLGTALMAYCARCRLELSIADTYRAILVRRAANPLHRLCYGISLSRNIE